MSHLERRLQHEISIIQIIIEKMDWTNPYIYSEWLAQTYFYTCHSARIIASIKNKPASITAAADRYLEIFAEEKNYELKATQDLKNLGRDIKEFSQLTSTQAFFQSQLYWIDSIGSTPVLGYFFLIEHLGIQCSSIMINKLLPHYPNSLSYLRSQSEDSKQKYEEFDDLIKKFDPQESSIIIENLKMSAHMYISILEGIKNKVALTQASSKLA